MKTKTLLFLTLLNISIFSGCKKYDEGPSMSLHTKNARVENLWKFQKVTDETGVDMTADYVNTTVEFNKDGNFLITNGIDAQAGKWELNHSKEDIVLTNSNNGYVWKWHIIKLKNKEMWAKVIDGPYYTEFHLLPK
jgi:hypothetical protein